MHDKLNREFNTQIGESMILTFHGTPLARCQAGTMSHSLCDIDKVEYKKMVKW